MAAGRRGEWPAVDAHAEEVGQRELHGAGMPLICGSEVRGSAGAAVPHAAGDAEKILAHTSAAIGTIMTSPHPRQVNFRSAATNRDVSDLGDYYSYQCKDNTNHATEHGNIR